MAIFTDIRKTEVNRTSKSREKYLKRVRNFVQDSLDKSIIDQSMDTFGKDGKVSVNRKNIMRDVTFERNGSGTWGLVRGGNDRWVPGDVIPFDNGDGTGKEPGEGTEYDIHLSQKEFFDMVFDGLELPDFEDRQSKKITETQLRRAGLSTTGSMTRLHVVKSYINGYARKKAIESSIKEQLEDEQLSDEVRDELTVRLNHIPMFETFDLRYRSYAEYQVQISHATVIFIMDVSGSMSDHHKALAKRFFWLSYYFLKKNYQHVDLHFIAHTSESFYVSEEEFFNSQKSGGTLVSPALKMAATLASEAYQHGSNVYIMQASDGDNAHYDNDECKKVIINKIAPVVQGMFYVDIDLEDSPLFTLNHASASILYELYRDLHPKLRVGRVTNSSEIMSVFRKFFLKVN